jgi:hypothetical protein
LGLRRHIPITTITELCKLNPPAQHDLRQAEKRPCRPRGKISMVFHQVKAISYGDDDDSPEDVEYTHEFIPNFHG